MATDVRHARDHMVEVQIEARGIRDQRVLAAMRAVPREAFVDQGLQEFAYEDNPLPIAESQTISQPYIVALMLEAAEIGEGDRVLEVGGVCGVEWRTPANGASNRPRAHRGERIPMKAAGGSRA